MVVVNSVEKAIETYKALLSDETKREEMGKKARKRVLREHTFQHRARQLITILDGLQA
jgi:spore maturation protein CgeB